MKLNIQLFCYIYNCNIFYSENLFNYSHSEINNLYNIPF